MGRRHPQFLFNAYFRRVCRTWNNECLSSFLALGSHSVRRDGGRDGNERIFPLVLSAFCRFKKKKKKKKKKRSIHTLLCFNFYNSHLLRERGMTHASNDTDTAFRPISSRNPWFCTGKVPSITFGFWRLLITHETEVYFKPIMQSL